MGIRVIKKKISQLLMLSFFAASCSFGQTIDWGWANSMSGVSHTAAFGAITVEVETDSKGNVYKAGIVECDSLQYGDTTLAQPNEFEAYSYFYVTKYNAAGKLCWAKLYADEFGDCGVNGIGVDTSGNVFLTGFFVYALQMDSIYRKTLNWNGSGSYDMFVAKLDSTGTTVWLKAYGSVEDEGGTDIDLDGNGNIVVSGIFSKSMNFGSFPLQQIDPLTGSNPFLAKLDTDGNEIWAKSLGTRSAELVDQNPFPIISVNKQGSILIYGDFYTAISLGSINLSPGSGNYLLNFDENGTALWGSTINTEETFGLITTVRDFRIAAGEHGNFYVTGTQARAVYLNSVSVLAETYPAANSFVLKIGANGDLLWGKSYGGTSPSYVVAIDVDLDDYENIYLTGHYSAGSATFDSFNLPFSQDPMTFIVKINADGKTFWANTQAGIIYGSSLKIKADNNYNTILAGIYRYLLSLPPFDLNSPLAQGIFIAKIDFVAGLDESTLVQNDLSVYPNPFKEEAVISLPKSMDKGVLSIYDMKGIQISKLSNLSGSKVKINRNNLPQGSYYFKLEADNVIIGFGKLLVLD